MSTRDLAVFIILLLAAAGIQTLDILAKLEPEGLESFLIGSLVFTVSWWAYSQGKGPRNGA